MHWLFTIFDIRVFADTINVPDGVPTGTKQLWEGIIPGVTQLLLIVALIISLVYLLSGGISWITAGGNKEGLENARKKVTYAILGLIIVLLSFFILYSFGQMFGLNLGGK